MKKQLNLIDLRLQKVELEKIKKDRETQEKLINELKGAVERQESEVRLKQILTLKENLKIKMSNIGFNEKDYAEFRKKLERLNMKYSNDMARMRVIPNLIGSKQVEMMSLQKNISEVEKAQHEKEKTEKGLDNLALLINSISDVQIIVRQQFIEIVNELLSEIWPQLYPYGDYASLRIFVESDGRRAGDYVLQLRERKEWVNVEGVASGGEKSIASLALRVAFSRSLSKLGLLLLDEPTHNLDENGIDNLTEVLREGMPNVLDQVVVITHEERMEKSATGFAYKLFRDKVNEEPTKIERL